MGEGGGYVPMITQGADLYNLKCTGETAVALTENTGTSGTHTGPTVIETPAEPGVHQQTYVAKCLNPWDVQSKHIQPEDGIAESLYSGECRYGGGESYVLSQKDNDT